MSSKIKPQTLKGFRDFLPEEKKQRDFVLEKIKQTFELFGFEPIETPALEYASLLLGKYGRDADKLVYTFKDRGGRQVALRYDQTVPLARVLNQYWAGNPQLTRRYQIQPVWRADKPQKGRYREFLQCDADIISDFNLLADAEILALFYSIYKNVGFTDLIIKVNDRQSLFDSLTNSGVPEEKILDITRSIDKLDKQPQQEIEKELAESGLNQKTIENIFKFLKESTLPKNIFNTFEAAKKLGVPNKTLRYQPTLARGLDYYTGLIFEGFVPEYSGGSIGGGGRYDKLIGQLTGFKLGAVGFGLGFDRTVEAAKQKKLIPANLSNAKVLVTIFDTVDFAKTLEIVNSLRKNSINTELFTEKDKLNNQLKYANDKKIPYVIVIGPDEAAKNMVTLKDMKSGKQETLTLDQAIDVLAR